MPNSKSIRYRLSLAALGLLCTTSLVVVACVRLGLPLNAYTSLVVAVCAMSGVSLGLTGTPRTICLPAFLMCVYLASPGPFQVVPLVVVYSLFDDVGGRSGRAITPELWFGHDGPNTAILESYVGPPNANWWRQAPLSPYIRDGNERVQSRSIIRYEWFPDILAMLPDDSARVIVIRALIDPENRLRVHQGLLLTALNDLGYPAGMDSQSWWTQHKLLFGSEHDPVAAASLTRDWLHNIERRDADWRFPNRLATQCRAVRYQQRGEWGGHPDFGEAFIGIEQGQIDCDARMAAAAQEIVWWPDRNAQ